MNKPYIGRSLPRFEDLRFVAGKGRYTDDFRLPNQAYAAFLRSPFPAANILSVDVDAARGMPGVFDIITAADYRAEGGLAIRHLADPLDATDIKIRAFSGFPGAISRDVHQWPLAEAAVRYVGEPVVMVVAETLAQAMDACEAVLVDYEETAFVIDALAALEPGAPTVEPGIEGNLAVDASFGDRLATDAAMAKAAYVIEGAFPNQRMANAQMEPRAIIADYDAETGIHRMIAGSQGAVRQRDTLAWALGVERDRVEMTCPDVGGGFGPRTNLAAEQPLLAIAARRLGRPVRWTATRSEAFLTDYQARDLRFDARLGLDGEGRILAYDARVTGNVGAYTVSFVPMANSYRIMTTVYHVPALAVRVRGAMTHTVPTVPFRGAGRPEAHYAIERLLDMAARRIGIDRVDIRRRNLVSKDQLPYRTPTNLTYDSGDFAWNMDRVLEKADWAGFETRRAEAKARGRLAGIGLANYIESPVGSPFESIEVTVEPQDERIEIKAGTQSTGQGHETSYAQVLADMLGVTPEQVLLVTGDTRIIAEGGGTHSDRSMRYIGELATETTATLHARARAILAHHLDCPAETVDFVEGRFAQRGSNTSFSIFDVARLAEGPDLPDDLRGPMTAKAKIGRRIPAHPTGAAVCELEIDPKLGEVTITRYTTVDDVGQPINPLIVDGQTHGGIFQGVGQAFSEQIASDSDSGQIVTGSFMDYGVLRADRLPSYDVELVEDPTGGNALRVKGGGESGITPALATCINAVVDALAETGIDHIDMPATPERIWAALRK